MEQHFKNLSTLIGGSVSLFKTIKQNDSDDIYEVLVINNYQYGMNLVFVKFPKDDFFTELYGSSFSSTGHQKHGTFTNPWKLDYQNKPKTIDIKINGDMLLIEPDSTSFSFLRKTKIEELNYALKGKGKYLSVPLDVYELQYCFKTNEDKPTYFVCVYPAYNFSYNTHRFFTLDEFNIIGYEITDMERYKDGGTTNIHLRDGDDNYIFHSPTPFRKDLKPTWTNAIGKKFKLIDVTPEEKVSLKGLLKLEFLPEVKER